MYFSEWCTVPDVSDIGSDVGEGEGAVLQSELQSVPPEEGERL
jgi:hypothetical protein